MSQRADHDQAHSQPTHTRDDEARKRRLEMQHLQINAGNPLTTDEIAMFDMSEREGWSHKQCRVYVLAKFQPSLQSSPRP
jgi:hypothetical protein